MSTVCAHVRNEHNAAEAVIEKTSFETFEEVGSLWCHYVIVFLLVYSTLMGIMLSVCPKTWLIT